MIDDMIKQAEAMLLRDRTPWDDVRKIVMSPRRYAELRASVPWSTRPNTFFSIDVEVYAQCADGIAVLIDSKWQLVGLYSFEHGTARWFDRKLLDKFSEPVKSTENWPMYGRYGIAQ